MLDKSFTKTIQQSMGYDSICFLKFAIIKQADVVLEYDE